MEKFFQKKSHNNKKRVVSLHREKNSANIHKLFICTIIRIWELFQQLPFKYFNL